MSSAEPSASNHASTTNGTNAGKSKTATNNTTAVSSTSEEHRDSAASRQNQASTVWHEFETVLKKMSKYSRAYSNIEGFMDQHSAMELESRTKDMRISSLQSSHEIQLTQFEKRYSKWNDERIRLEHREASIKHEMMAQNQGMLKKQEVAQAELVVKLEAERKKITSMAGKLEKANKRIERVETELVYCKGQLREWDSCVSKLTDIDFEVLGDRVKSLFTDCHDMVRTHFSPDLPEELFADHGRWDHLSHSLAIPLSIPPTNSSTAKHVRMATALHIIARQLCTHLFKPCYIPEPATAGEVIKEILARKSAANTRRELIMRALLLSAYNPNEIDAAVKRAVQAASKEALTLLGPFFSSRVEAFRKDLEALLYDAAAVWKEAQHSQKMVDASVTDEDEWPWAQLDEFDSAVVPNNVQPGLQQFDMLNLFPRIFVPEDDHIVYPGVVVWSEQKVVHAADQELRDCIAARRTSGERGPNRSVSTRRERRQSVLTDGRDRSIASMATGSRTGNGNAFLEKLRPRSQTLGGEVKNGNRGEG